MDVKLDDLIKSLASDVRLDSLTVGYVLKRFYSEGIKFLTVTLPKLSKTVIASLELGYFDRSSLTDFAWKGRSLRYFRSLLNGIFCPKTGVVLDNASSDCILRLRQFCEYFYKLALEFDRETEEKALEGFLRTEESLAGVAERNNSFVNKLRKDFESFYKELSGSVYSDVFEFSRPRNGPGTWSGMGRFVPYYLSRVSSRFSSGYTKPERGSSGYFKPYPSAPTRPLLTRDTSDMSELLFVPKDSRGPRTIVREPYFRLKAQLAFFDWFSHGLTKLSRGRINFRDQAKNRDLARQSSISKEYCTIDLKDASDRVSGKIVETIFRNSPAVRYFVSRRSRTVVLPNGDTHQLRKLSGMGSGLTFPIMSLLAHLSIVRRVVQRTGLEYRSVAKQVYTYGDDIIVPSTWYTYACEGLSLVGLMVNRDKSFVNSCFRESCGGDYYNGYSVGPVRLRLSNSAPRISKRGVLSLNASPAILQVERHCRELVKAGLFRTSEFLYSVIEQKLKFRLPIGTGKTACLCRYTENSVAYPAVDGTYVLVRAILPCPVIVKALDMDPYYHLSKSLSPFREIPADYAAKNWWDTISSGESTYLEVSVPRSVRYSYRDVSSYSLMG